MRATAARRAGTRARPHEGAGEPSRAPGVRDGRRIGLVAGAIAITCCTYPVVLFLLGLSSGTAAISLGNRLYGDWAWAFRGAGLAFAVAAVVVHLKRRGACSIDGARRNSRMLATIALVGTATYGVLYGITKGLAALG